MSYLLIMSKNIYKILYNETIYDKNNFEISLLLTNNYHITKLNKIYLNKNKPTNVAMRIAAAANTNIRNMVTRSPYENCGIVP